MKFREWYADNNHKFKNMTQWDSLLKAYNNGVVEGSKYGLCLDDYEMAIEKFDACRGCLARLAEKLAIELPNEAPAGVSEWHEHLIHELDNWQPQQEKP